MKLLLPSLLISLLSIQTLFAQLDLKWGLRLSPIMSMTNYSDLDKNEVEGLDLSNRLGFSYGIQADIPFSDQIGLHTGIHIVEKGFKTSLIQGDKGEAIEKVRITSLELPIALKLRSPEIADGLIIRGLFGAAPEINVGYTNTYQGINPFTGEQNDGQIKASKYVRPLSLAFLFGAGIEKEIADFGMVDLGITFHKGLSNINAQKHSGRDIRTKISYLAFDLAYYF